VSRYARRYRPSINEFVLRPENVKQFQAGRLALFSIRNIAQFASVTPYAVETWLAEDESDLARYGEEPAGPAWELRVTLRRRNAIKPGLVCLRRETDRHEAQWRRMRATEPHRLANVIDASARVGDPTDLDGHIEILYGAQPYSAALERRKPGDPCPVCKGRIRPGERVYCEVCSDFGLMKTAEHERPATRAA
jgi:hypothetical protein